MATVPDTSTIPGWPETRRVIVRVAKAPPPPEHPVCASVSPVRLHPTVIVEAILEVASASANSSATTAVAAVSVSPRKSTAKRVSVGALETTSCDALAAGGAVLGS